MYPIPVGDRVLIRREEVQEKKGNIFLHGAVFVKPPVGEVLTVGTGRLTSRKVRIPIDLKEGDRVAFDKDAGTEVVIKGESLLIIKSSDILGDLDPETTWAQPVIPKYRDQ